MVTMSSSSLLLIAVFAVTLLSCGLCQSEPPKPSSCKEKHGQLSVDLYYESLCPDSLNFVVDQVKPTIKSLGNCVNYHLIPWGNAKIVNDSVECQHGEAECLGNKLHACSFSKLKGNLKRVEFVTCYFESILAQAGNISYVSRSSKEHVITAAKKCSNKFHLDWKDLEGCGSGPVGSGRHLAYGEITSELNPPIKWVPMTSVYVPERTNENDTSNFQGRLTKALKKRGITCTGKDI